jgi:hypothetical protein
MCRPTAVILSCKLKNKFLMLILIITQNRNVLSVSEANGLLENESENWKS